MFNGKKKQTHVLKRGIMQPGMGRSINFTGTKTHYFAINLKMRRHKMSDVEEAIKENGSSLLFQIVCPMRPP